MWSIGDRVSMGFMAVLFCCVVPSPSLFSGIHSPK